MEQKQQDEKKENTNEIKSPTKKKHIARTHGISLPISKKHGMYLCTFIKNKPIDTSLKELENVLSYKRAIPFKGEIPHRKGMMSGRYPLKATRHIINLLKTIRGNAIVNGLDLERTRITQASSHWASRPLRAGGRRAKRTNIVLIAQEIPMEKV